MTVINHPPQSSRENTHKTTGKDKLSKVSVILTLLGLLIVLYPVIATVVENYNQRGVVEAYVDNRDQFTPEELSAEVQAAHEWNDQYQGAPLLDPWLARIAEDNEDYTRYKEQLNLTEVMGRVAIPAIHSDLPIYHGTTEEVLKKGIGHLYGSSLPVGGPGTHAVLTGHTGMTSATLWDNLTKVHVGDAIYLEVSGQRMKYQVYETQVVLPDQTDSLKPAAGEDLLTLITCTPYAVNTHRLLVHAHRVPIEPAEEKQVFEKVAMPWQSWMTWVIVALVALGAWMLLERHLENKRAQRRAIKGEDVLLAEGK